MDIYFLQFLNLYEDFDSAFPPFQYSTVPFLHFSILPISHYSIPPFLHSSIPLLLHFFKELLQFNFTPNEHFAGFAPFEVANNAGSFQLIDDTAIPVGFAR